MAEWDTSLRGITGWRPIGESWTMLNRTTTTSVTKSMQSDVFTSMRLCVCGSGSAILVVRLHVCRLKGSCGTHIGFQLQCSHGKPDINYLVPSHFERII